MALGPIDRADGGSYNRRCIPMKHFSGHRFDEQRRTLWRGTREIRLTRKAAGVLQCLIERAGRVVTRDTILSTVWSGTHVHADNVKVPVHEIRTALEDDPREPNFIRSEPGGGTASSRHCTMACCLRRQAVPARRPRSLLTRTSCSGLLLRSPTRCNPTAECFWSM